MTKYIVKQILRRVLKALSWVLFFVTLLAAYGGYFNPAWWTLPAVAVLIFPYLAIATLIVSLIWLFLKRYIIGAIGILVLMACGPTFVDAVPLRFRNSSSDPERTFKMVTFNCLHMEDIQKPDGAINRSLHFLIHSGADFICLQELYAFGPPEIPVKYNSQIDSIKQIYPYYSTDGGREIEFASKYPFKQIPVNLENHIKYGNVAAYELEIEGHELTVVNVHLPSYLLSDKEREIITQAKSEKGVKKSLKEFEGSIYGKLKQAFAERAKVAEAIGEFADSIKGNVIICGDFNDVPGSWTYRTITKKGFEDAYAQTGFGHLITYNQHLMWFHIDQILYRGDLEPLYVKKERLKASDHYPLIAEFEFL